MRIVTWNINGLATTLQYYPWCETKSYKFLLDSLQSDIICLQEVKVQKAKMTRDMALVPGYDGYFSFSRTKLGYSGVAVYVKQPLQPRWTSERVTDLPDEILASLSTSADTLDAEGRCIIMDFGAFILFNVYFPNTANRFEFKMDYHRCVQACIESYLAQGRQVILVGDINAVHETIDHCDPKQSMKDNDITDFKDLPHRQWLDLLIAPKGPLIDVCRDYHPDRRGMYTCWNTKLNARPSNYGTRIDYILASSALKQWFTDADIQPDIQGSDHCPVYLEMDDAITKDMTGPIQPSSLLTTSFDAFSSKQKKLSTFFKVTATSSPPIETAPSTKDEDAPKIPAATESIEQKKDTPDPPSRKRKAEPMLAPSKTSLRHYFHAPAPTSKNTLSAEATSLPDKDEEEEEICIDTLLAESQARQDAKVQWSSLFKAPDTPLCRLHKEPCREYTVTKKGPNQGRRFYACSRPVGPSEEEPQTYRCNFFQWKKTALSQRPMAL